MKRRVLAIMVIPGLALNSQAAEEPTLREPRPCESPDRSIARELAWIKSHTLPRMC